MDILLFAITGIVLFIVVRSFSNFEEVNSKTDDTRTQEKDNNNNNNPTQIEQLSTLNEDEIKTAQIEVGLVIALMAKLSKSDGHICMLEQELLNFCFKDFSKPFENADEIENILKQIFENEKSDDSNDIEKIANEFYNINKHSYTKRVKVLQHLINLAYIDNVLSKSEESMLKKIATILQIDTDEFTNIMKSFHKFYKEHKSENMNIEDAYLLLEVNEHQTLDEIKKSYRKLVKKYHPDLLRSKGFEDDYIQDCTNKIQQINTAYEIIKKTRK
jgi:DnaJ like chaperone protein